MAKGFHQMADFYYYKAFSLVIKSVTIQVLLTMSLAKNWAIRQLDINNTFLHGLLSEEVFMEQPIGFYSPSPSSYVPLVCKLKKALYGLKQTPNAWYDRLKDFLLTAGFVNSLPDTSAFIRITSTISCYIFIYVDDIIVTGSSPLEVSSLIQCLHQTFALKDLGILNYFLGIEVSYTPVGGMFLSQTKYIYNLLHCSKMFEANEISTPMLSGILSARGSGIILWFLLISEYCGIVAICHYYVPRN